jgi:hypothetical protein
MTGSMEVYHHTSNDNVVALVKDRSLSLFAVSIQQRIERNFCPESPEQDTVLCSEAGRESLLSFNRDATGLG